MVLSNNLIKSTLDEWLYQTANNIVKDVTKNIDETKNRVRVQRAAYWKDNWDKYTRSVGYQWATFIANNNWTHTATIRPFRYPLNETRAYDLISRLTEFKMFNKVFYTMEKDTTGFNHCHLLMDTKYEEKSMKHIRWDMNTRLGQKWNSGMVQYVDEIRSVEGISRYITKHIKANGVYNLL
tara:strand:+ start:26 stop:568 length:543 start_codon:yes stop_codon:yes gene_type:complete